jgi:hypothetical protein
MPGSTYKIIELVGTSEHSWEEAAKVALKSASSSLKDLRIAEVIEMDMKLEEDKPILFRTRLKVSFKYQQQG